MYELYVYVCAHRCVPAGVEACTWERALGQRLEGPGFRQTPGSVSSGALSPGLPSLDPGVRRTGRSSGWEDGMQMCDAGAHGPARPPWASTWQWWPARRAWAVAQGHPQPPWGLTPPTRRHTRSPPRAPRPPLPAAPCLAASRPRGWTRPSWGSSLTSTLGLGSPLKPPPPPARLRSRPQQPLLCTWTPTRRPEPHPGLTLRGWAALTPPTQTPVPPPEPPSCPASQGNHPATALSGEPAPHRHSQRAPLRPPQQPAQPRWEVLRAPPSPVASGPAHHLLPAQCNEPPAHEAPLGAPEPSKLS